MPNIYELPFDAGAVVQDQVLHVSCVHQDENHVWFTIIMRDSLHVNVKSKFTLNDDKKAATVKELWKERDKLLDAIRLT